MRRRTALAAAAAVLIAACSGSDEGSSPPSTTTTVPTTTTVSTATTAAPATTTSLASVSTTVPVGAQLEGRWAHYDVVADEDDDLKTLIISYGFNDFTLDDGVVIDQASFCFSEQRTDQPITTALSDAATQAIQPPPTEVDIDMVVGVLRLTRPASPTPVGIRLDDPFTESLPTDPNDPRIVDDDGDGRPGITVSITVTDDLRGELYIARREIFAYEAFLTTPDRLDGVVTDDSEQLVIGASDPIFATSPANWRQHPDPTKSPVLLVRVDGEWDCERLRTARDTLFPPTPEVDW